MADLTRLFSELIRWETELWNDLDTRLRDEMDLPLSRFEPLQVMERLGSCRVQDIARELSITVGGVSKLVDRLEANGLCRRRANPDDGRSSIISLTSRGRRMLAAAGAVFRTELEEQIGSALPESEVDRLTATLTRLREHRSRRHPAGPDTGRIPG